MTVVKMSQSQNVPFVSNQLGSSCGTNSPPMSMFGYQCDANKNQCAAVTQFSYAPSGGSFYFSSEQCSNVCGGLAAGTYVPDKALD